MLAIRVEWTPLSTFDSHAHFVLCVGEVFSVDVTVRGGFGLTATNFGEDGEYRSVGFRSPEEFEQYLRFEIRRRGSG